jgi:conjugative relaxase-like TrwC/TraI family protein
MPPRAMSGRRVNLTGEIARGTCVWQAMAQVVLTIRKIRVASGDDADARRAADYFVASPESPEAFAHAGSEGPRGDSDGSNTRWLGSSPMLGALGVSYGAGVERDHLARALQGRNTRSGERIRREGWIQRRAVDEHGRPLYDERGRRVKVGMLGTKSVDLTFSTPKSVSVVWSQAPVTIRSQIELAMITSAEAMLECMTQTKPVVKYQGQLTSAHGFAAAAALHVTARTAQAERFPSPQLHVHGIVVGVERADGLFASPELSGMFKAGAPLEGGAVARAKLAEQLLDIGFEIQWETGTSGRFFEIRHVPRGLLARMSGRTRDVEAKVRERQQTRGARLTNEERAVAALQTRARKRRDASTEEIAALWRAQADEFGFGSASVNALVRAGGWLSPELTSRASATRAAVLRRLQERGPGLSPGESRAIVLECAAGRLRLNEALALLEELSDGEPVAGQPTG